jgi:anti-anti-sigma regulatory factor
MSEAQAQNNPLVVSIDGSLDSKAGSKISRIPQRVRETERKVAILDLRAARSATSEGWGALMRAVSSMTWAGAMVTVLLNVGLKGIAELSGLRRHARVVVFDDAVAV